MWGLDGIGRTAIDRAARGLAEDLGLSPEAMDVMGHAGALARGDVLGAVDGLLGQVDAFESAPVSRETVMGLAAAAISGNPVGMVSVAAEAMGIDVTDTLSDVARGLGLNGLAKGIETVSETISGAKEAVSEGLSGLGEAVSEGLSDLGETVSEGLSDLGEAVSEGLSDLGDALGIGDDDAETATDAESADADAADANADGADAADGADGADGDGGDSDGGDSDGGDGGGGDK